ncbi:hypothetical protein C8Q77DRAFT_1088145 [Trametes polyzona]|nr:hypothetical protein C8Q77DRAFT_1088145 [Trametes polyzona]
MHTPLLLFPMPRSPRPATQNRPGRTRLPSLRTRTDDSDRSPPSSPTHASLRSQAQAQALSFGRCDARRAARLRLYVHAQRPIARASELRSYHRPWALQQRRTHGHLQPVASVVRQNSNHPPAIVLAQRTRQATAVHGPTPMPCASRWVKRRAESHSCVYSCSPRTHRDVSDGSGRPRMAGVPCPTRNERERERHEQTPRFQSAHARKPRTSDPHPIDGHSEPEARRAHD